MRPDYVETGNPVRKSESMVKSADVIARMRVAGAIARDVLVETGAAVAPGVTTDELDRVSHEAHIARSVYPSPLGYQGFPKSVCTSVNEVICHGIPDDRALVDGDIVNIDVTVYVDGVHGDTNATFARRPHRPGVQAPRARRRASASTSRSKPCAPARPCTTSAARSRRTRTPRASTSCRRSSATASARCSTARRRCRTTSSRPPRTIMEPGMVFTIEPMITIGDIRPVIWDDGWTAVTADGSRSAQFEHTVLVTDTGVDVLTR